VPLLGDIPILGYLFRHTREVKRKSELVILLKPTVVEGDHQWSQQLRQSSERFKQMGANPPM
jgi:MSHA biogenesis protein MshL